MPTTRLTLIIAPRPHDRTGSANAPCARLEDFDPAKDSLLTSVLARASERLRDRRAAPPLGARPLRSACAIGCARRPTEQRMNNPKFRSLLTPPERRFYKPHPLRAPANPLNYQAFDIRTKLAVVRLLRRKRAKRDERRPEVGPRAGPHDSDNLPGMAAVCGIPTTNQGREKERPDWRDWRTKRNPGRTLSFVKSMAYKPHKLQWMLPGESSADSGGLLLQRQAGRCAACNAVFDPDLEQGGRTNIVVRRDPATGDTTRVLVHRWCRPGRSRGRPRTRWPIAAVSIRLTGGAGARPSERWPTTKEKGAPARGAPLDGCPARGAAWL
jgi:hypothetical protein